MLAVSANTASNTLFVVVTVGVALFASVTAPLLLLYLSARTHRRDRLEDYKRQDQLADEARLSREGVDAVGAEITRQLEVREAREQEIADKLEHNQAETSGKLDVIHELVNSRMTAALQAELDSVRRELALMRELTALKSSQGMGDPTPETLAAMIAAEKRIGELISIIEDRKEARHDP